MTSSARRGPRVERHLEEVFGRAEPEHFAWQTSHPVVGEEEARLVRAAFLPLGSRVLDVGCAEGATLLHLGAPENAVGIDLFADKIAFAQHAVPSCTFRQASAYELPFDDGAFDHVLLRDVIHHLDEPERAISEIARVLEPGGRVDVLEPCRWNPLIFLHAITNRAERGELRSTKGFLTRLLTDAGLVIAGVSTLQALPIHRVVFHPKLGRPSLGRSAIARAVVSAAERVATTVMPEAARAYVHVRARR